MSKTTASAASNQLCWLYLTERQAALAVAAIDAMIKRKGSYLPSELEDLESALLHIAQSYQCAVESRVAKHNRRKTDIT